MNAFEALLDLSAEEKKKRGVEFTPPEIAQQPSTWNKLARILQKRRTDISRFMRASGMTGRKESTIVLTGAGTSEFIGNSIVNALRRELRREVISVPTTHLVTHAASTLVPSHSYVVISFARSGNSPESVATFQLVKQVAPSANQLVITCNRDGALAKAARKDPSSLCIELPEETNDQSLAMTSSFSTMALAGLGLAQMKQLDEFSELADRLGKAAYRIIVQYGDDLKAFAGKSFTRACFLGSNTLFGTMQECHLKMQEMTSGRVACRFESFLGLRHGPQVFVNNECVVFAALSSDAHAQRYEMDMLRELKSKKQGCGMLILCGNLNDEIRALNETVIELFPGEEPVPDEYRVMTDVVAGQIFATFKSLNLGLKPDAPSATGTINRVVQGVVIYENKK